MQVKWSGRPVQYSLEGEFPEMLFTISRDGVIYLNAPLDRETQDQVMHQNVSQICNNYKSLVSGCLRFLQYN